MGKYTCLLLSDKPTSDLLTSEICFLICILYMFLTNKGDISCIYLVAAIRKIKVKQRRYGLGLNGVQHIPQKNAGKPSCRYIYTENVNFDT